MFGPSTKISDILNSLEHTTEKLASDDTSETKTEESKSSKAKEELKAALGGSSGKKEDEKKDEKKTEDSKVEEEKSAAFGGGDPASDLTKIAADIASAEEEAIIKEAHIYGASVCDGFMSRMQQYEQAAEDLGPAKTASYQEDEGTEKLASVDYGEDGLLYADGYEVTPDLYQDDAGNVFNSEQIKIAENVEYLGSEFADLADEFIRESAAQGFFVTAEQAVEQVSSYLQYEGQEKEAAEVGRQYFNQGAEDTVKVAAEIAYNDGYTDTLETAAEMMKEAGHDESAQTLAKVAFDKGYEDAMVKLASSAYEQGYLDMQTLLEQAA